MKKDHRNGEGHRAVGVYDPQRPRGGHVRERRKRQYPKGAPSGGTFGGRGLTPSMLVLFLPEIIRNEN